MQPTAVFLPGEFYGQRNLAGYGPWGPKRVRHNQATNTFTFTLWHSWLPQPLPWLSIVVKLSANRWVTPDSSFSLGMKKSWKEHLMI